MYDGRPVVYVRGSAQDFIRLMSSRSYCDIVPLSISITAPCRHTQAPTGTGGSRTGLINRVFPLIHCMTWLVPGFSDSNAVGRRLEMASGPLLARPTACSASSTIAGSLLSYCCHFVGAYFHAGNGRQRGGHQVDELFGGAFHRIASH